MRRAFGFQGLSPGCLAGRRTNLYGAREQACCRHPGRNRAHRGCEHGNRSGTARLSRLGNSSDRGLWRRRRHCCGSNVRLARSRTKVRPSHRELADRAVANSFLPAYRGVLIAPAREYKGVSGLRSTRSAQDEHNSDAGGSRRGDCTHDMGCAHGADRDHARLRPATPADAELRARQPVQGLPGRGGRDVNTPEQHGHRSDGDGIRRRRACRPGAGASGDAGRQCRHHAHCPGAVVRCVPGFVSAHPDRRFHVPAQRGDPHARSRPGRDRAWPDANRASAPAFDDHSLRGRAEPADAARCGHDRPLDRHSARRRIDVGGAFERRRRVVGHGLCGPSGRAAARPHSRSCLGPTSGRR